MNRIIDNDYSFMTQIFSICLVDGDGSRLILQRGWDRDLKGCIEGEVLEGRTVEEVEG